MAKKGKAKKGKKKKQTEQDPNALTEVDKTFYELTIADLNRKLARLRSLTQELEEKNEELKQNADKNEEDKSDIITYLKRMLQEKTDEINELEERITALQETRQNETEKFEQKILELENEFQQMHEQLTSENKLLEGKLNSLEEFRSQRDELMKKFDSQEQSMENQEKRHKREMYEIERKFIISKDKLKKDMEARLLQLSTEFHDASELRIAATTHRVIRENIAVNNELDSMLTTHQKLYNDNKLLKNRDTTLRQQAELHEAEKKQALAKVRVQMKVIDRLTREHQYMTDNLKKYKHFEQEILDNRNLIKEGNNKVKAMEYKIKLLEQNLEHIGCQKTEIETEINYLKEENLRLTDILTEGVSCIKEALTVKQESDLSLKAYRRENLLNTLFALLSRAQEEKIKRPSLETIQSIEGTYTRGDLGFLPKIVEPRPDGLVKRTIQLQTGPSFEEFLARDETSAIFARESFYEESELISQYLIEEGEEEEVESILFFDENESVEDESGESRDIFAEGLEEQSLTSLESPEAAAKAKELSKLAVSETAPNDVATEKVKSKLELMEPSKEPSKEKIRSKEKISSKEKIPSKEKIEKAVSQRSLTEAKHSSKGILKQSTSTLPSKSKEIVTEENSKPPE